MCLTFETSTNIKKIKNITLIIMVEILVPIAVCVILPVSIIWIIFHAETNKDNKRTEVLIKAIETNNDVDADRLAEAMSKPKKTPRELLNLRLLRGCIFSLVGLAFIIVGVYNALTLGADSSTDSATIPLLSGGLLFAIGVSYLIVYAVTRKQVKD